MTSKRVPSGTPTGGQFAASARDEASVDLGAPPEVTVTSGEDGETLVRRFACENHDGPGQCTPKCVDLEVNMTADPTPDIYGGDPTGVHRGPERPYETYEYDEQARASICVTHVPEGLAIAHGLQQGQTILVDGEPRTVDSISTMRHGTIWVDFESNDREPDGTPTAYLSREFNADQVFDVDMDQDTPQG